MNVWRDFWELLGDYYVHVNANSDYLEKALYALRCENVYGSSSAICLLQQRSSSQGIVVPFITQYGSTGYIGMALVVQY